jgi:hypothetical protein
MQSTIVKDGVAEYKKIEEMVSKLNVAKWEPDSDFYAVMIYTSEKNSNGFNIYYTFAQCSDNECKFIEEFHDGSTIRTDRDVSNWRRFIGEANIEKIILVLNGDEAEMCTFM